MNESQPQPPSQKTQTIDEICNQAEGSFAQFCKDHPDPDDYILEQQLKSVGKEFLTFGKGADDPIQPESPAQKMNDESIEEFNESQVQIHAANHPMGPAQKPLTTCLNCGLIQCMCGQFKYPQESPVQKSGEEKHRCIACPVEVRGIYAVAYNLLNLYKSGDADRVRRKLPERMAELQDAVNLLQPIIDRHFNESQKP